MASPPLNGNGGQRRKLRARVLAEETHCALCGQWVDKTLHHLHPRSAVVDEDLPRARGGSQYDRENCHLMCRTCNRLKGTRTIAEMRALEASVPTVTKPVNLVDW